MYIFLEIGKNDTGDKMKIKDVMTKDLIVGKESDTIFKIAEWMKKYDIGFIPIARDKKIVGVITDRDIVVKALANGAKPNTEISNYMTENVITIEVEESIDALFETMKKNKIKRVLVTDHKRLVGVVSLSDLIEENKKVLETMKEIWQIRKNDDTFLVEIDEFYL